MKPVYGLFPSGAFLASGSEDNTSGSPTAVNVCELNDLVACEPDANLTPGGSAK